MNKIIVFLTFLLLTPSGILSQSLNFLSSSEIDSAGSISGTILADDTGLPIPNVAVYAFSASGFNESDESDESDETGYYKISGLPPGDYRVTASGNDIYAGEHFDNTDFPSNATPVTVISGNDTGSIDFSLAVGSIISGNIIADGTRLPISGVYIRTHSTSGNVKDTTSNINGHYEVCGLFPGDYTVYAYTYPFLSEIKFYVREYYNNSYSLSSATPVTVTSGGETTEIDFSLALGGTISGNIIADDTGLPISGVYMHAFSASVNYGGGAFSSFDGRYTTSALLPGDYIISTSFAGIFEEEYFDNVYNKDLATLVNVTAQNDTSSINFSLAKDMDGDGVSPAEEDATPNSGDGNDDGIYDSLQSDVASVVSEVSGRYFTVDTTIGSSSPLTSVQAYEETDIGDDPEYALIYGLVAFDVSGSPGFKENIRIYFHGVSSLTNYVYRKYNPITELWGTLPDCALSPDNCVLFGSAKIDGQEVAFAKLTLTDGVCTADVTQIGDGACIVDSVISDPGGPALLQQYDPDDNGDGDVDGLDVAALAIVMESSPLAATDIIIFASSFGR